MLHRGFKHSVMKFQDKKSKLGAFQNLFGVENNQVLIRKYEIIGIDFDHVGGYYGNPNDKESFIAVDRFKKYPPDLGDFADYEFINIFTQKEYIFIYLKNLLTTLYG